MHITTIVVVIVSVLYGTNAFTDDPEIYMNTSEVIKMFGYPCEIHETVTDDGYILSLQRIPFGKHSKRVGKRPVAFLQHGLVDSSFTWVNNYPNESLGFILADNGFDVWLANSRGNEYSSKHTFLSPTSRAFWDFSWDEMVKYDLDASINYIINLTEVDKISYIGHSQGTEIAFAKFSQSSSLNSKISSIVALAPIAYVGNLETVIKYLAYIAGGVDLIFQIFDHGEFLPSQKIIDIFAKLVCGNDETSAVCRNLLFLIAGHDTRNLNETRLPVYMAHTPSGTSVKNMVHYAQSYKSNMFRMYDYGYIGNIMKYHQFHPPTYDLDTKGIPVALFSGGNDYLADPTDVARTTKELGNNVKYQKIVDYYNHMDFIWGENAANVIYKDVISFMRKYL